MVNKEKKVLLNWDELQESIPLTKPLLKRISCLYVPATDPAKTEAWFAQHFGLDKGGWPWLTLRNGLSIMFIKAEKGQLMNFQTDAWGEGSGHQMNMLDFEVVDINEVYRSLKDSGVEVGNLVDNGGCGIGFEFFDPDGNKFVAWELQTTVRRNPTGANSTSWKERLKVDNCYFDSNVDTFLTMVSSGSLGASRRILIPEYSSLLESDGTYLNELLETLEQFSKQNPEHAFRVFYREEFV